MKDCSKWSMRECHKPLLTIMKSLLEVLFLSMWLGSYQEQIRLLVMGSIKKIISAFQVRSFHIPNTQYLQDRQRDGNFQQVWQEIHLHFSSNYKQLKSLFEKQYFDKYFHFLFLPKLSKWFSNFLMLNSWRYQLKFLKVERLLVSHQGIWTNKKKKDTLMGYCLQWLQLKALNWKFSSTKS